MRIFLLLFWCWSAQAEGLFLAEVRGSINPGSADFILESLRTAEAAKADAFVLRLDTPGGLLSSTRDIIQGFSESSVPIVVWISPGGASATSAGALITLSAHVAVMAPGTNIGAAHPVGSGGEDVKGKMGEKVANDTAALARAQAALHGRNTERAEEIVTKSKSFSPDEALKAGVIDGIAGDLPAVLKIVNGRKVKVEKPRQEITIKIAEGEPTRLAMNPKQKFLHFIADPNVSTMLLSLAGLAIWAEVSSGFSSIAAGVVGIFCLVLGLVSLQTLPVNIGGAVLLGLGFFLLVLEAFVTSYGLLSVAALVSLFLGGLFLIDPASGSMQVSLSLLIPLVVSVGSVLLWVGYVLARDRSSGPVSTDLVGARAQVTSVEANGLRGVAQVNGELWSFETGTPVSIGDILHVKTTEGLKIFLERNK